MGESMRTRTYLILALVTIAATASAVERQAYRYVDEQGNVTYSQTPPPAAKDAKKVDISPANRGRGGYVPEQRSYTYPSYDAYRNQPTRDQVRTLGTGSDNKQAQLIAECERNRGSDCRNPDALRYMEDQKIPRSRR